MSSSRVVALCFSISFNAKGILLALALSGSPVLADTKSEFHKTCLINATAIRNAIVRSNDKIFLKISPELAESAFKKIGISIAFENDENPNWTPPSDDDLINICDAQLERYGDMLDQQIVIAAEGAPNNNGSQTRLVLQQEIHQLDAAELARLDPRKLVNGNIFMSEIAFEEKFRFFGVVFQLLGTVNCTASDDAHCLNSLGSSTAQYCSVKFILGYDTADNNRGLDGFNGDFNHLGLRVETIHPFGLSGLRFEVAAPGRKTEELELFSAVSAVPDFSPLSLILDTEFVSHFDREINFEAYIENIMHPHKFSLDNASSIDGLGRIVDSKPRPSRSASLLVNHPLCVAELKSVRSDLASRIGRD